MRREHLIPWHQIGSLVLEQGPLEKWLRTGTIIPLGTGDPGAGGRKAGREPSRSPLECLSGIREPELVMEFLQEFISRPANGDP
jgi:hypothetical protein